MKRIMVILSPGFEEGETVEIIDILRRAKFECDIVSISGEYVQGTHQMVLKADRVLNENMDLFKDYDMIVLPGGWSGVDNMLSDDRLMELIRYYDGCGKWVAAMCAAPNVLAKAGVTKGRVVTSYPGSKCEPNFMDARYVQDIVAIDRNMVTSRGPATALPFAFALVDVLGGDSAYIKARLLYDEMKRYPDGIQSPLLQMFRLNASGLGLTEAFKSERE